MTFSEYLLRVEGWHRQQKRQLYRDRRTWYNTLIGPHYDPKHLPRSEEAYMPIDGDKKPKMTKEMREEWDRAVAKYKEEKDGNPNN